PLKDLLAPAVAYRRGLPAKSQPADRPEFRRPAPAPRPFRAARSRRLGGKFPPPRPSADILSASARLDYFRNEKHGPSPCWSLPNIYAHVYTHLVNQTQAHLLAAHPDCELPFLNRPDGCGNLKQTFGGFAWSGSQIWQVSEPP